jgi:hypothetical protein
VYVYIVANFRLLVNAFLKIFLKSFGALFAYTECASA